MIFPDRTETDMPSKLVFWSVFAAGGALMVVSLLKLWGWL